MAGMGSIYVGTSGLQSAQNALNTTAHNLANVDTSGYTRQQVVMSDTLYNTLKWSPLSPAQVGLGNQIAAVRQVRDTFLDAEYRVSAGRQAFYETCYDTFYEIETYFGELESVQFNSSLTDLWDAVSELAKQPDDGVRLATLKEMSVNFVNRAEAVYNGLASYQSNMNLQITDTVDRINELGKQIYDLNIQIRNVELGGKENANDLRDARNQALDELSGYINISYEEDAEHMVHVKAENADFVTGLTYHKIGISTDNAYGFATPVWEHLDNAEVFDFSLEISTSLNTDIGKLKALVLARGDEKATYVNMPVAPVESDYTDPAEYAAALAKYNDDLNVYNTYTSASAIMNVQAEFDQLFHGVVTAMNDILCPNTTVTFVDDMGVTHTLTVLDEANASYGADGQIGIELFTRDDIPRYKEETFTVNGETVTYKVFQGEDTSNSLDRSTWYTIGKVHVNEEVLKDPTCLGFITGQKEADLARAKKMVDIWSDGFAVLNPNVLSKSNFREYYTALISEIGNMGSVHNGSAMALESATTYLDNKRTEVTGVSSDEELTSMIKFQSAYNAASRYITTISEMLEHIVTTLGA